MSNRWERGQSPPYTLTRATTGGTVLSASSSLKSSDTGAAQLSIAGQFVPYLNPSFHQGDGEAAVSGYVTPSGQTLNRTTYNSLFSRLSTTWGVGDGLNTFTLPNINGGASFQAVTSPSVPKPLGTVSSGNFTGHTHTVLVNPDATGSSTYIPNAGTPQGYDPTGTVVYANTSTAYEKPSPNPLPMGQGTNVRMFGTSLATALAVQDAFVLPVGTIIGYIGTSTNWSNTAFPWLLCDGSAYERSSYPALYAVFGTTYGTTTSSNFKVPDLRGRFLYHTTQYSSQYDTMTIDPSSLSSDIYEQMPQHIHSLSTPVSVIGCDTRSKNAMSPYGPAPEVIAPYSSGPGNQLVPANASVLWLVKAS